MQYNGINKELNNQKDTLNYVSKVIHGSRSVSPNRKGINSIININEYNDPMKLKEKLQDFKLLYEKEHNDGILFIL